MGVIKMKADHIHLKYKNNSDLSVLPQIFADYPEIEAVYLFGSAAGEMRRRESDLDLAVLCASTDQSRLRLDLLADLARRGFCNVDLVFLDTEDIVLKFEAVSPNRLIYRRRDFEHGAYFSKVVRQYLDFLPYLNVQRAAYKRRLLSG